MDGGRNRPRCPSCGWTYYAKPALGAAVFIEEDDRILLVQRAHEPYKDWWMLPAGYVEYGEDALETAVREALEETSLVVEVTGIRGLYFGAGDPRGSSHLAVFSAKRHQGTPTAGDDAADVRWFGPNEIPERIAFDSHRKAISQWLKGHGQPVPGPSLLDYSGAGPAAPLLVYVVIENPKGTVNRLVYDEARHSFVPTGEIFSSPLPIHYGWIPRTVSPGDDRELDVTVVGEGETAVGSVVAARPIGTLLREDLDHKVLAVRVDLPTAYATVTEASQRPELQSMIEDLFRSRAELTGWATAGETRRLVMECQRTWVKRHRTDR
jgi:8-oxo-dGTP diphosphatase